MKRRVVNFEIYREFLMLGGNNGKFNETRLGAAYGSYLLGIGDAMTFVHVTERKYNFVLDKISMVTY